MTAVAALLAATGALAQGRPTQVLLFGFGGDKAVSAQVTAAVKAVLKQGGSIQVTEFRTDLPSLKRAIMERRVSRNDISSSDPVARMAVARALEADYFLSGEAIKEPESVIVTLFTTRVRTGAKADFTAKAAKPDSGSVNDESLVLSSANTVVSQFLTQVLQTVPPAGPIITRLPPAPAASDPDAPSPPPSQPDTQPQPSAAQPSPQPTAPSVPVARNPDEEAAGFVAEAESLAASGNVAGAIQAMRSAVNVSPRDARLRLRLAELYTQRGMKAQADREIEAAAALGGSDGGGPGQAQLAAQLLAAGKADEAEALYRAALKEDPADSSARVGLGDALWARGKPSDAALEYAQAANENKNDAVPYEKLARLHASRGLLNDALTDIQAAASRRGKRPDDALDPALYRSLIRSADVICRMHMETLNDLSKKYSSGSVTREQYHDAVRPLVSQVDDLIEFHSSITPPRQFDKSHLHRMLAASLLGQAVTALEDWLIGGTAAQKEDYARYYKEAGEEIESAAAMEKQVR